MNSDSKKLFHETDKKSVTDDTPIFNISPMLKPIDQINFHLTPQDHFKIPVGAISSHIFQQSPAPFSDILMRGNLFSGTKGFIPNTNFRKDSLDLDTKSPLLGKILPSETHLQEEKTPLTTGQVGDSDLKPFSLGRTSRRGSFAQSDNFALDKSMPPPKSEATVSFFKDLLPWQLEKTWGDIMNRKNKFIEFSKNFDVSKNVENLIFLEENDENKLQEKFLTSYDKLLHKLKETMESYSLNIEVILRIFHQSLCSLFQEIFELVQNCTSDYCFELMKKRGFPKKVKIDEPKPDLLPKKSPEKIHEEKPVEHQEPKNFGLNLIEALATMIDPHLKRKSVPTKPSSEELLRNLSKELAEKQPKLQLAKLNNRKTWTQEELDELDKLVKEYYPESVPTKKLEEFAKRNDRTLSSIQTKMSKMKKKGERKNSDSTEEASENKYTMPLENMIKTALLQFPSQTATKEEIVLKVRDIFFFDSKEINEESMSNSIASLLSSKSSFAKIKGTYALKSEQYILKDISEAQTLRTRLRYILTKLPRYRGTLKEIRDAFSEYFSDAIKFDQNKSWETSLVKVLKQCDEFDSSDSKTKYKLIGDN